MHFFYNVFRQVLQDVFFQIFLREIILNVYETLVCLYDAYAKLLYIRCYYLSMHEQLSIEACGILLLGPPSTSSLCACEH